MTPVSSFLHKLAIELSTSDYSISLVYEKLFEVIKQGCGDLYASPPVSVLMDFFELHYILKSLQFYRWL